MRRAESLLRTLERLELAVLARWRPEPRFPPLFTVGAPRSGTTFVYLGLVNTFSFAFFPNLAKRFDGMPVAATAVARYVYPYRPTYRNSYGVVPGRGAPSDAWRMLHRWFPEYDADRPVQVDQLEELRWIYGAVERLFDAPVALKNNNNGGRISHLASLFPQAIFVNVVRDPIATIVSNLQARRANGIPTEKWWGAAPREAPNSNFDSELERVAHMVRSVRDEIDRALGRLAPERRVEVRYEAVCADADPLLEEIERRYAGAGIRLRRRRNAQPPLRRDVRRADSPAVESVWNRLQR